MAETVKHTPGPWYRGEGGVRARVGYVALAVKPMRYQDQPERYEEDCARYEADQDLQAAAPEMLEALAPFAKLGSIILAEAPSEAKTVLMFTSATGEKFSMTLDQFRAAISAIAKAEGRS